ncbi:PRC-barrel domain-containing protein [Streptomyces genisteinicus]|uniref:PRC-barrel domain-containing protein n=1 Tax=Streptomyces genisteinicus TaxID=2768068 RepID=A0A7H0HMF6_9ACTN|nr:PRC-barrel domain-containing protein [Streptomyces genisteinicus]QNP61722.1 PRC-barrel domain-containing protein [Streptomyces genisteinicus]
MIAGGTPILTTLTDSDQAVAHAEEDVRGRKVRDAEGNDLGRVADLLVDAEERKVRFLLVEHGGFLGLGEKKSFVPVDAVVRVTDDSVHIAPSHQQVAGAPAYDPDLVDAGEYYAGVYRHYGYAPYWGAGYVYPGYPFIR